jgi:hypothetical protein
MLQTISYGSILTSPIQLEDEQRRMYFSAMT